MHRCLLSAALITVAASAFVSAAASTKGQITVFDGRHKCVITFADFIERLQEADIICLGEIHESQAQHRFQAQLLKALFARDKRLGVGLEIFQRPFQKFVDDYVAETIGEDALLKGTEYAERWGYDWSLYQPIVDFCRSKRIPLAALNAPRELTRQVSRLGYDGLAAADKEQLAGVDFDIKAHRDHWFEYLDQDAKPEANERWYQVMTVWDGYMAESAAAFQQTRSLRRLLIIAGSGHIEHGFGIPNRAAARTGGRVLTIGVQEGVFEQPNQMNTDFLVFVE